MTSRMRMIIAFVLPALGCMDVALSAQPPAVSAAIPLTSATAGISWDAPRDGGTPRDPARIEALGACEFRIRARDEELSSTLKHAVSRVDLVCMNHTAKPQQVTLHLDLSGDGRRTDADRTPSGGMSLRDFIFIQLPGRPWIQVQGKASGWVSTVAFTAPPGETRIGLSPWYAYGDYLRFVQSLPSHSHLKKERVATSDGGRELYELTITDPAIPDKNKRRVYWHAREHAYETFSSYAMEGLVAWLLSDAAAEARRHFIFTLHPMTNVDGVADGNEYRGGYDVPNPRATASVRLVYKTIDRLRPELIVAWHNWIAPRDVDSIFFTGGENGQPSRRAWDLFTQRFPSPRAAGHSWQDETQPNIRNWFGRSPLNEYNPHQYAMKRYGSAVWGWEMPWWNRTVEDARRAGADFGRAFTETQKLLNSSSLKSAGAEAAPVEVPRWGMHEFTLQGRPRVDNPFRDAALVGEFTSPSGKLRVVEGFYDGHDTWRLRFAPDEEGEWRYRLRGEGVELSQHGRLRCVKPQGRGFIGIHPKHPYAFACADGAPFFPMGDTCYGLFDDSHITPTLRREYLETRRAQRFNFVRMSIGHSELRAAKDPAFWAWGGSPSKPDLDRLNPAFFRGLDDLFSQMQSCGMNAELLLFNYYRRPFTDPRLWTPARERLWLRYVIARYAAFSNIFLWTLSNEYETHPDGRYRLDRPGDVDWAIATARQVKALDPYRHPVTVHPVISSSIKGDTPRAPFDPPWRIGGFFGKAGSIDVLSQQTASAYPTTWDEALGCWTGDPAGVSQSIAADRVYRKPVLNTENGYEYQRGGATEKRQVHHTDKVRRASWRIVCAGGYLAAGFNGTIGHSDVWERIDPANRYPFAVRSEGAATQLGLLYDFFTALPFWRMHPWAGVKGEAVALADPPQVYALYLPQGGAVQADLSKAQGPLIARWFNPRDGKWGEPFEVAGGKQTKFKAPDANDWALLLRKPE